MTDRDEPHRTANTLDRTRRDIERFRRREINGRFWRSLALIGSVGWPIVLLATGGALFGQYLDRRWGMGIRFTLMLLTVGTVVGSLVAYRTLRENGS